MTSCLAGHPAPSPDYSADLALILASTPTVITKADSVWNKACAATKMDT